MTTLLPLTTNAPPPQGLINIGANCYFNSIMQCLLSCTSLHETLKSISREPYFEQNRLCVKLLDMFESTTDSNTTALSIYRDILTISSGQNTKIRMDTGQQDSHEGLMMVFNAFETIPPVERLFTHRYLSTMCCAGCSRENMRKFEVGSFIDVSADFTGSLNEHIAGHSTVVSGYRCECGYRGDQEIKRVLTRVPDILIVLFKKYSDKSLIRYPSCMSFEGINHSLNYKLIATSEHSGSTRGGHYWANVLRNNTVYTVNDASVSPGSLAPTSNSYLAFYHFVRP